MVPSIHREWKSDNGTTDMLFWRFVTLLAGRRPWSKMCTDASLVSQLTVKTAQQSFSDDLQDIHRTILQHEKQQIMGVQLANAGRGKW